MGLALFLGGFAIIGFDVITWKESFYFLILSAIFFLHSMKSLLPKKRYQTSELVLTVIFLLIVAFMLYDCVVTFPHF